MYFIKIWLFLFSLFVFFMSALDYKRIYDTLTENYSQKDMVISKMDRYRHSGDNLDVEGYIDKERVVFYKNSGGGNYEIEELHSIYPNLKKGDTIKVIKFKHSSQVMVVKDNEFPKWKKDITIMTSISIIGIIIFGIMIKKHKFEQ